MHCSLGMLSNVLTVLQAFWWCSTSPKEIGSAEPWQLAGTTYMAMHCSFRMAQKHFLARPDMQAALVLGRDC